MLLLSRLPSLTEVAALLSRSGGVETHGTSKYRTPPGYRHLSAAPTDFGLDARWGATGIRQEVPWC